MEPLQLQLSCAPFAHLEEIIQRACRAPVSWEPPPQVKYLNTYLRTYQPQAQVILIETPYVDRHYVEEYSAYYATALRPPPPQATRLHFFTETFDDATLRSWLIESLPDLSSLESRLNNSYLGCVTIRPLPSAPIGRTILKYYQDVSSRFFEPAQTEHKVHLLGVELLAQALPFQQQEQAVGACATTALWSALYRAIRSYGGRAPTPFSLTTAATKHLLNDRAFPAVGGLDLQQMIGAIREMGLSPYTLKPSHNEALFLMSLKCYLRSGIPAVLFLDQERDHHAVTVAGFREDDDEEPTAPLSIEIKGSSLQTKGMSRLYVHDDRFGPYMRMKLIPQSGTEDLSIEYIPRGRGDPIKPSKESIRSAIFPLYPKLRLSAPELITIAGEITPFIKHLLAGSSEGLSVDLRFILGGRYIREALGLLTPVERATEFAQSAFFSRYVGVIRYLLHGKALADVVCDTTDISRDTPPRSAVLAILPYSENHIASFREYCRQWMPWVMVV